MSAPVLAPGTGGPPRPDASMTLLREVVERPLDPSYAEAAASRAARASARAASTAGTAGTADAGGAPEGGARGTRRRALATGALAVLAGLLVTGAVLQLRLPAPPGDRAALVREITDRTQRGDRAAQRVQLLRTRVQAIGDRALDGDPAAPTAGDALLVASGSTAVRGPGVVITLQDAPAPQATDSGDPRAAARAQGQGLVRYDDLQLVANGLWQAGAEAVAINGQRLTGTSAIRNAGTAILVNYRPLSPPYRIQAIGSPNALQTRFALTEAADLLLGWHSQYGIGFTVDARDHMELPAQDAQQLNYAHAPQAAPPAAATAPAPGGATAPPSGAASGAPSPTTREVSP